MTPYRMQREILIPLDDEPSPVGECVIVLQAEVEIISLHKLPRRRAANANGVAKPSHCLSWN